jgi:hypothetical protein
VQVFQEGIAEALVNQELGEPLLQHGIGGYTDDGVFHVVSFPSSEGLLERDAESPCLCTLAPTASRWRRKLSALD